MKSFRTLALFPFLLALFLLSTKAPESDGLRRAIRLATTALDNGQTNQARNHIQRALERDPKSIEVWLLRMRWAEAADDRDELVYSLHKALRLSTAQKAPKENVAALEARLLEVDPLASELLGLRRGFRDKLLPLAQKYEKEGRPHSAIRVLKEILALDSDNVEVQAAIERIASAPDPSLAVDAKPKDLLADISDEWVREHDVETRKWDKRAALKRENYVTNTNAGYEVLVRSAEAMEQMNAFYRVFFDYGLDGGGVSRIDLNIFRTRDEYLELGIGPPVEWSGGHFTGGAVETYIDSQAGFEGTVGTLFHEAAHQFVSLATNAAGWLNEGLASFFEGCQILPNGTVRMNLPATHRLFPLARRMKTGWMVDEKDEINTADPSSSTPTRAPTFRIVLENRYEWGPPWYAPTWGVVYFLYNYQDPVDGRYIYRKAFREFFNASGGRSGEGAVTNFEEVVLANPAPPTKGVSTGNAIKLPKTVAALDEVWKDWILALEEAQTPRGEEPKPWHEWALYAITRGDLNDAAEHYEKGLIATPQDPDIHIDFAKLLIDEFDNEDRATKLLLRAARLLEGQATVDEKRLAEVDKLIRKIDKTQKSLDKIHEELLATLTSLVQGYLAEGLDMMAMDTSWRMGSDFEIPEMFEYFEEGLRRSQKTLNIWKLAYNEQNFDGWSASAGEIFGAEGDTIVSSFETFDPKNFEYRFLTLEELTYGDFSMEAEILADKGRINFCGIVFGRKSQQNFHGLLYFPPGKSDAGIERRAYVDLATFYGDTTYDTWVHTPVDTEPKANESTSGWHKLRVDVIGTSVDIWFDDEFVTTYEFANLSLLQGRFGLVVGKGDVRFRNVRYLARTPLDPGAEVERALKLEATRAPGQSANGSWLGMEPPFPRVQSWVQGERSVWNEGGLGPQLLVLWSMDQNRVMPLHQWLTRLAADYADYNLRIVSVASFQDAGQIDAYLRENPFPGVVGVDEPPVEQGIGLTYDLYAIDRFFLPRLILLDIDGTVAWEGDPGFSANSTYDPSVESYLRSPLDDLIERRKLKALVSWCDTWTATAAPALAAGDVATAMPAMVASREFDWKTNNTVLEAQRRLNALEVAVQNPHATAEAFAEQGCEPAFELFIEWSKILGQEIEVKRDKELKAYLKRDNVKAWGRFEKILAPLVKRAEGGKDIAPEDLASALERLATLEGTFPALVVERIRSTQDDPEGLRTTLLGVEGVLLDWLTNDYFGFDR